MRLVYVLRRLPHAFSFWWWKSNLSDKYTCSTVRMEAFIPSLEASRDAVSVHGSVGAAGMDESTEYPLACSVRAVEVEAFTGAFVKVNWLPQQLSRKLSWK